jgi:D-lactate dehydrogenase (cytochrome)
MGSGLYETSANGVIALEIVDGRGRLVHTQRPAGAFLRSWGPDLTGMFLGDCGVFGLKARVVLKLMRRPTHAGACAFRFADFDAMAEAFRRVAGLMIASDMLGLDPEIQKGFLGALTPKGAMNAAKAIWAASPGPIAGARALLAAAAAPALSADAFAGQFTVEGWSSTEVKAKVQTIRQRIGGLGAETSNAGPLALRGDPFLPLAPVAPMSGGRWLPTHGLLPHSNAKAFHRAYEAWLGEEAETLRRHHIRLTRMFVPVGASAIVYEPTFYWPDALSPAQTRLAPRDYLAKVKKLDAAPDARAQVARLRRALTDLMRAHGAQHFQLGKWYTHLADRDPAAAEFLRAFKAAVDPHGLLNPGALDF